MYSTGPADGYMDLICSGFSRIIAIFLLARSTGNYSKCNDHSWHGCLRTFFLLANQSEECMSLRCCGMAIPLAIGRQVLTGTEVEAFKEKHEKWNTAERCYCPVPVCSTWWGAVYNSTPCIYRCLERSKIAKCLRAADNQDLQELYRRRTTYCGCIFLPYLQYR